MRLPVILRLACCLLAACASPLVAQLPKGQDLDQKCYGGGALSCATAADVYADRHGPGELASATRLYVRGCDLGNGRCCQILAQASAVGFLGMKQNPAASTRLLVRAVEGYEVECEGGELASCRALEAIWSESAPPSASLGGLVRARRMLCKADSSESCGPELEWPADAGAWQLDCARGGASACWEVARELRKHSGTTQVAVALDEWACLRGERWSCAALADDLVDGGGLSPSAPARALELFRKTCELGDAWYCSALAESMGPDAGAALRARASLSVENEKGRLRRRRQPFARG